MSKLAIVLCAVLFASAAYSHPSPFMKRDISHAVTSGTGQELAAVEVGKPDLRGKSDNKSAYAEDLIESRDETQLYVKEVPEPAMETDYDKALEEWQKLFDKVPLY